METLTLLDRARTVLEGMGTVQTRELSAAIAAQYGGDPARIGEGLARLGKQGCPLVWRKEPYTQTKGVRRGKTATHYHWRYSSLEWSPPSTARPAVVAELPQPLVDEIGRLNDRLQEQVLRTGALENCIGALELSVANLLHRVDELSRAPVANSSQLDDAAVATLQRIADIMRTQGWDI